MRTFALPAVVPFLLCLCLPCKRVEAYEVLVWFDAGCSCSYSVNEQSESGSLQVCAQILFIPNGTEFTTSNYTVTISADNASASAQREEDYILDPTDVTFPNDSAHGDRLCVTVNVTDDVAVENNESFHVQLTTADERVEISTICQRALFTIYDSDAITVRLLDTNIDVNETDGSVQLCVNVTHGSVESSAYIRYSTISGSARGNRDFQRIYSNTLIFPSGDGVGTVRCFTVGIYNDRSVENSEFFTLSLQNGVNAWVTGESARINILDNDVATIGMETSTLTVTENRVSTRVCVVLINSILEISLTAIIETSPVTATENSDYAGRSNFSFTVTGTYSCTYITIYEDSIVEYNEIFNLILTENSDRLVVQSGRTNTQIRIVDDNDYITVRLNETNINVAETAGSAQLCVQITHGSVESFAYIRYSTYSGSAIGNWDFSAISSNTLTFLSGDGVGTVRCFTVEIYNDTSIEYDEFFTLSLRNGRDAVATGSSARINILDNDVVVIGFLMGASLTVTERVNMIVTVCPQILEGTLERDVSVFATTMDMSARASLDFIAISGEEITFTSGQTVNNFQCMTVTVLDDDNVLENVQSFQVVVSAVDSFINIASGQESIMININEDPRDGITVGLQQTSYNTSETGGPLSICVQMFIGTLERNVSLTVTTTDDTANGPGDYSALNTQLVLTTGQTAGAVVCASLDVIDDNVVEMNEESLTLSMSADDPTVTTITASSATIVIRENDNDVAGSITLTSSYYDAYESEEEIDVCAVITAEALEREIVVHLTSQDTTARNVEDYLAFQFVPLIFDEGSVSGEELCHHVVIIDDDILENSEEFSVTLTSPEPAFLISNLTQATVTINPDPADFVQFGFQQGHYSVSEQNSNTPQAICVEIDNGSLEREVVINLNTVDITTEGGIDYFLNSMMLTFTSGQSVGAQSCAVLFTIDDSLIEDVETFNISLAASPSDEGTVRFTIREDVTTVTILQDPNDRAVVQLQNSTYYGDEGDEISVCAELVSIDGGLRTPLTLSWTILNGTAENGLDFISTIAVSDTITFPLDSYPGNTHCVIIDFINDTLIEANEDFVVELSTSNPSVMISEDANLAVVTIRDIPHPLSVAVSFLLRNYSDTEGTDLFVEVCVQIVFGTLSQSASVDLWTVSQTATAGSDFSLLNTTLTFLPGETIGNSLHCADITILNDEAVEADEIFTVVLSSSTIIQIIGTTSIDITIYEDISDFVTVGLQMPPFTAAMENEAFMVCTELTSGFLERDVYVGLEAESNNAIQGVDFIGPDPSLLTFTSGQSMGDVQCANVRILDDTILNGQRNLSIKLTNRTVSEDGSGVKINDSIPSVDIIIDVDTSDRVTVGFSQSIFTTSEDDGFVQICAELLEGELGTDISLLIQFGVFTNDSATYDQDYVGLPRALSFASEQSLNFPSCVNVTIIDDDVLEERENFTIVLSTEFSGVSVSRARSLVEIADNDYNVTISLHPLTAPVRENETFPVCAELISSSLEHNINVVLEAVNNSAIQGIDFIGPDPSVLTFTSGQSAGDIRCANLTIVDDSVLEGQRNFKIRVAKDARGNSAGVLLSATVPLINIDIDLDLDDRVTIGFSEPIFLAFESDGLVEICAEISSGCLGTDISLPIRRDNQRSSAMAGKDYFGLLKAFSFASGQSVSCFNVSILEDSVHESKEMIILTLSSPDYAGVIVSRSQSVIEIIDNDEGSQEDNETITTTTTIVVHTTLAVVVMIALAFCFILVAVLSVGKCHKKGSTKGDKQESKIPLTMIS